MRKILRTRLTGLCLASVLAGMGVLCGAVTSVRAEGSPLRIYLNADQTHAHAIGSSLALGLAHGLKTGRSLFGTPEIEIAVRDHRNNLRRSQSTVDEALADPATLAVMGGMHTPHYLRLGPQINEAGLLLVLPWSAGATLTRLATGQDNYIFRLSVDDQLTAPFLSERAAGEGCAQAVIIALDNGWGAENARALEAMLPRFSVTPTEVVLLREDSSKETVIGVVEQISHARPDCVLMILTHRTAAFTANALAGWDAPPRVLSHWGILGGAFHNMLSAEAWRRLDLQLIATCMFEPQGAEARSEAPSHTAALILLNSGTVQSRMAFIHAYDLSLLLSAAIADARHDIRWSQGRPQRSAAVRDALEALDQPVSGLLKHYDAPFAPVWGATDDGHEALRLEDLCMARIARDGRLYPSGKTPQP